MIARTHRFHGHNSLNFVYRQGKTTHSTQLSLKYVKNEHRKSYRIAVVVSKKVSKSAVKRNRIRRRIYELIRQNQAAISAPYDIVLTVFNEELATLPTKDLEQLVVSQLKQAKII